MAFLTIMNYIAMGIGYIALAFILLFLLWIIADALKERQKKKSWEKERADKEKVDKMLADKEKSSQAQNPAEQSIVHVHSAKEDEEKVVDEKGQLKVVS